MGRNIRLIAYSATAAATLSGGVGTAAAALTGDSLIVEDSKGPTKIIHWSQLNQSNGGVRLIHNSGHDSTQGFKSTIAAGNLGNILNRGLEYYVRPQETLKVTQFGGAVSGDVDTGIMLLEREMEGLAGEYITFDQLRRMRDPSRQVNLQVQLAASAAGYGTEESLVAETDYLWGDRKYAVLGISANANAAAVVIRGPDTGNVKIGCPVNAVDDWPPGGDFFCELSRVYNDAFIPVIKSNNKAGTFLSFIADENLTTLDVTIHLALLNPGKM